MKIVYSIDTGAKITVIPSRRDAGKYEIPDRTTVNPPPEYNPKREYCKFYDGIWTVYSRKTNEKLRNSVPVAENIMNLLRQERDAKLMYVDRMRKKYDDKGMSLPDRWVDYRNDLLNVPQHVELGFTDPPKLSGGVLVYNFWPEAPTG